MSTRDEEKEPSLPSPENDDKGVQDVEEAIAYLEGLTARDKAVEEDSSTGSTIPMDESLAAEDLPSWVTELPPPTQDEGDSLSWLQNISQKGPSTEQPTAFWAADQMPSPAPDAHPAKAKNELSAEPVQNIEDAMAWLDELAATQGTPLEEMQTVVISPDEQNLEDRPNIPDKTAAGMASLSVAANNTDDPMAWLEQLAADQNTPLEELPSVAARLLASEIISQVDEDGSVMLPIALEEALYYLEDQVAEEGISLAEITVPEKSEAVDMAYAFKQVDQLAAGQANALTGLLFVKQQTNKLDRPQKAADTPQQDKISSVSDLSTEMPDDPDEVLAWLEGLAKNPQALAAATAVATTDTDTPAPETKPVVEEKTPTVVHEEKALPQDDGLLPEMPEDPDEAMAWLEKVAAAQSAADSAPDAEDADAQFAAVNQVLQDGDIEQAAAMYHEILQQDALLPQAVVSLETAVANNPNSAQLRHLLGDAYMRQGQMQKALEVYRQGFLDHL